MPLVAGNNTRVTAKLGTTVSGTSLTGWTEQVSGTRELTVPVDQNAPQIVEQLNGVDVFTFNNNIIGVNDGLGNRGASGSNATMIYALVKSGFAYSGSNGRMICNADSSAGDRSALAMNSDGYGVINLGESFFAPAPVDEWVGVALAIKDASVGDPSKIYYNGDLAATSEVVQSHNGSGISIGGTYTGNYRTDFVLAEAVEYYDVVEHTEEQVKQNIAYFESEWALTLLPPKMVGPITKDGLLQSGVIVQVTAYDDDSKTTGKQDVGDYVTDVDGMISIPQADIPAGKTLFFAPHFKDGTSLFSDQLKSTI